MLTAFTEVPISGGHNSTIFTDQAILPFIFRICFFVCLFFILFIYLNLFIYLIYLFLAALGLRCCTRAFSSCKRAGATLHCSARASHCGGLSCCRARAPGAWASVAVAPRLSCSSACGILPDQGSNPRPPHWQADSQTLCHQGSPQDMFLKML